MFMAMVVSARTVCGFLASMHRNVHLFGLQRRLLIGNYKKRPDEKDCILWK